MYALVYILKQNRTRFISCRNLSKAEKERLRAVRESAASGGLKVGGVTTDAVKQMMLLQVQWRTTIEKRLRDSDLFSSFFTQPFDVIRHVLIKVLLVLMIVITCKM